MQGTLTLPRCLLLNTLRLHLIQCPSTSSFAPEEPFAEPTITQLWAGNAHACSEMVTASGARRLLVGTEPADVLHSDDGGRTWTGTNTFQVSCVVTRMLGYESGATQPASVEVCSSCKGNFVRQIKHAPRGSRCTRCIGLSKCSA